MSFFNLTISYFDSVIPEDLPPRQKRNLFRIAVSFLILLTAVYLYATGAVISQSAKRANLRETLSQITNSRSKAETAFLAESSEKTIEYFILAGYEKSATLESVKRASNVASNQ